MDITIRDSAGNIVWQDEKSDIRKPLQKMRAFVSSGSVELTEGEQEEMGAEFRSWAEECGFTVEELSFVDAEGTTGRKVEMCLSGGNSYQALEALYLQLEVYAQETNRISWCDLWLEDANGACLYYMTGNFLYGNCSTWVDHSMQENFAAEAGPAPEE